MPDAMNLVLKNDGDISNLLAYITGTAIQHGGQRCLVKANGRDLYFPKSPSKTGSHLAEDCAIPLGGPGNVVHVSVPQMAGGRIWIAEGPLTFLLNPGPALVEPSVLNPSDPNASVNFGFCEFTLNSAQLYANISYVDFVSRIPIALTLETTSGQVQRVLGLPPDGLDGIASDLQAQARKDHHPWDELIVKHAGRTLRVLNATHGTAVGASFDNYYDQYIEKVWHKYSSGARMKVDTQAGAGVLEGHVNKKGELVIGPEFFPKPTSADVLGCNTGPFTTGASATRNAIIPRLAAGFVRSALLQTPDQPSRPETYYKAEETNHYARIVHLHNLDGRGYSFAYDDVIPTGVEDQSGKVNASDPKVFTVLFGGKTAAAGRAGHQMPQPSDGRREHGTPPPVPSRAGLGGPPPVPSREGLNRGDGWKAMAKEFGQKVLH